MLVQGLENAMIRLCSLRHAALVALTLTVWTGSARAQVAPERPKGTPELMRALAQGGYVIYFRHGHTHWQQKITEAAMQAEGRHDLANCATQRNLDDLGRADGRRIHQALQAARIPIGKVLSSLYCRPAEYVALITGRTPVRTDWLSGLSTPATLVEIRREVATAPPTGSNTFLGGHGDRPFDLTGLIIQEGDALVFDPRQQRVADPAKFRPLAWIKPSEWAALAGAAAPQAPPDRLGKLRLSASAQHDAANLAASLPALVEGLRIDHGTLARALHLARDNPAKNTEVQFTPSAAAGAVDAHVMVAGGKPWSLMGGLTNTSVAGGRRERVLLGGEYVNLWNRDHQVAFLASAATDNFDRSGNASLAYRAPLPALGGMLEFKSTRARDNGGIDVDLQPITGAGRGNGLRYRQHLTPLADYHHQLSIAVDDRQWSGFALPLRSRPLSIGYSAHWEEEWSGWKFDLRAVTNLSGGAGNDGASYTLVRPGAKRGWSALRADGDWLRVLTYDIRLVARMRAQLSGDALIPGEQFALGGALQPWGSAFGVWQRAPWLHTTGVRGLPERALAGDSGAQGSIELWSRRLAGQDLRVGGFFDAGTIRRKDPAPGVTSRANASSLGLAMHYQWRGNLALSMSAAHVLRGAGVVANHDNRVDVALVMRY